MKVTLPDGNIMEVENGFSAMDVAKQISPSLAKKVLAAKVNGEVVPVLAKQENDFSLELLTDENDDQA
jgi:threonyl-tRNA synthetase